MRICSLSYWHSSYFVKPALILLHFRVPPSKIRPWIANECQQHFTFNTLIYHRKLCLLLIYFFKIIISLLQLTCIANKLVFIIRFMLLSLKSRKFNLPYLPSEIATKANFRNLEQYFQIFSLQSFSANWVINRMDVQQIPYLQFRSRHKPIRE